jgi:hypothetical protein
VNAEARGKQPQRRSRPPVADPLENDDDLAALAALAIPSAAPVRPPLTAVPQPQQGAPAASAPVPVATPVPVPTPVAAAAALEPAARQAPPAAAPSGPEPVQQAAAQQLTVQARGPEVGNAGDYLADEDDVEDFVKQSNILLDVGVERRFRAYQDDAVRHGRPRPKNHQVVFDALNATDGRYRDVVEARKPKAPEGARFGRPVRGRQAGGPRLTTQVNFRPTVGERREIEQLAREAGAESTSAFLNAVLDEFLPPATRRHPARG